MEGLGAEADGIEPLLGAVFVDFRDLADSAPAEALEYALSTHTPVFRGRYELPAFGHRLNSLD